MLFDDIKYISQKHDYSCAVACLAMVTKQSYEKALSKFHKETVKDGVKVEDIASYLSDFNLTPIVVDFRYSTKSSVAKRKMNLLFADIHIAVMKTYADSGRNSHCIVINKKGKVLDPANKKRTKMDDFFDVIYMIGIFDEYAKR
jgi:ABC-type bacteriocin/lantibiotic exporter with double-glycine peptidase domain